MQQLHPLKMSVIKFQTSEIKLQTSAKYSDTRNELQISQIKYRYLYLVEDISKRLKCFSCWS